MAKSMKRFKVTRIIQEEFYVSSTNKDEAERKSIESNDPNMSKIINIKVELLKPKK